MHDQAYDYLLLEFTITTVNGSVEIDNMFWTKVRTAVTK